MKTCVDCGCDLPLPVDEFGDLGEERCAHCHLEYLWNKPFQSSEEAQEEIERLQGGNSDLELRIEATYSEEDDTANDWNVWDEWISEIAENEREISRLEEIILRAEELEIKNLIGEQPWLIYQTA